MEQPRRKPNRLPDYDYTECGGYFLTICTRNREKLFWDAAGHLSWTGEIVDAKIREIPLRYSNIRLDHYVVMPNHIHLLLVIKEAGATSISNVVCQMKGAATKEIGYSVWQKLMRNI